MENTHYHIVSLTTNFVVCLKFDDQPGFLFFDFFMNRSTIKDVASLAGVSDTTVSLAFQSGSRISSATRERVLSAAAQLSYTPNLAAKHLRNGSSNTLGFLVNDITNPFYSRMFRKLEGLALHHGYTLLFVGSNWSLEKEQYLFEQLIQMRVCGVLMCLCEKSSQVLQPLTRHRIPYIAVDSHPDWYAGAYVGNDFRMAGELAARHLYEQGCRRLAYFSADRSLSYLSPFVKMREHFLASLQELGLAERQVDLVEAGLSIEAGRLAFKQAAAKGRRYDGVFCANDLCAMGVMEAAEELGQSPGKQIAIVGIDDMEVSSFARVSLSSIRQPYEQIAEKAMRELLRAIQSKTMPKIQLCLPAELVVRNSSQLANRRKTVNA